MIYVARKAAGSDEFVLMESKEDEMGAVRHSILRTLHSHEEGVVRMFVEYLDDDLEGFRRAVVEFVMRRGMEDPMSKRAMKVLEKLEVK